MLLGGVTNYKIFHIWPLNKIPHFHTLTKTIYAYTTSGLSYVVQLNHIYNIFVKKQMHQSAKLLAYQNANGDQEL